MIRRPPRSTRTDTTLSLHDALPISAGQVTLKFKDGEVAADISERLEKSAGTATSKTSKARPSSRSEEHTSELQSLMRISYAVFCLKKKQYTQQQKYYSQNYIHHTIDEKDL